MRWVRARRGGRGGARGREPGALSESRKLWGAGREPEPATSARKGKIPPGPFGYVHNCLSPSALCFHTLLGITEHSKRYPQLPPPSTMGSIRIEFKAHVGTIHTTANAYWELPLCLWLSEEPPVSYSSQHSLQD